MPVEQDQRPSFFQGQYLGPEDLTAAVEYGRIQQARHSLEVMRQEVVQLEAQEAKYPADVRQDPAALASRRS